MDCAILGILMDGPAHGYDIWLSFKERFSGVWSSAPSQLYLVLSKMEKEGLVKSVPGRSGKRPPKKVFSVTEKGRAKFFRWLDEPISSMRRLRIELLAKLHFVLRLCPERIPSILDRERSICKAKLEEIERRVSEEKSLYKRLVYLFKASHIETNISWIGKVERILGVE